MSGIRMQDSKSIPLCVALERLDYTAVCIVPPMLYKPHAQERTSERFVYTLNH